MKNILIFGAGSIGNHMSKASSDLGYNIFITDKSELALQRMKTKIYPARYKKWNKKINLVEFKNVFSLKFYFDLIIVGTPPTSHFEIFKKCKEKLNFKKILIEKPIANYPNNKIYNLKNFAHKYMIFCGYNHSVNPSLSFFLKLIKKKPLKIKNIFINWKEGWKGILGAHPWLKDEFSSYLGNSKHGGGAIQEHSHGIHALICILKNIKIKNFKIQKKIVFFKKKNNKKYDYFSSFFSKIKDIFIKYETDLITYPANKNIKIELEDGYIKWICNYKKNRDAVVTKIGKKYNIKLFKKTRSSEFANEIKHIMSINNKKNYNFSPINLNNALKVYKIIAIFFINHEKYI